MFKWRLVNSLLLLTILVVCLSGPAWVGATVFSVFTVVLAAVAVSEFLALTNAFGFPGFPRLTCSFAVLVTLAAGVLPVLIQPGVVGPSARPAADGLEAVFLTAFLVLGFRQVFRGGEARRRDQLMRLLVSFSGLIYICWTLSFISKLFFCTGLEGSGRWLAFFIVFVTKAADIGAYAIGSATARRPQGNHKMVPTVSPKKSWEGFFGGMLAAMAVAAMLVLFFPGRFVCNGIDGVTWWSALLWGAFAAVLGFWGDLAESAFKRAANAKNSGILPGLGGVLDVLDSLILVVPFFYAYIRFAVLTG